MTIFYYYYEIKLLAMHNKKQQWLNEYIAKNVHNGEHLNTLLNDTLVMMENKNGNNVRG